MDTLSLPSPDLARPHFPARHAGPLGCLRRHLDGGYSLARTYWLHLFAGTRIFETVSVGALQTVALHLPANNRALLPPSTSRAMPGP